MDLKVHNFSHVVLVHREPIIDRIPNLKSMIEYLADTGYTVAVFTTRNSTFPVPVFQSQRVQVRLLSERTSKLRLPTTLRLFLQLLPSVLLNGFSSKKTKFIFAGRGALTIAPLLRILGAGKYMAFVVEYPPLPTAQCSLADQLERAGIRQSYLYVTHDALHARLINREILKSDTRFTVLPNATLGASLYAPTKYLHERLALDKEKQILLHSGGFGDWFSSRELAARSCDLPGNYELVFHLSHRINTDAYFIEYLAKRDPCDRSVFSTTPVRGEELDSLVASARIGVAWYNQERLDFRAVNMGLAAGKIGNYLKRGVPVIAPNLKSLSFLREFGCGLLLDELHSIGEAVSTIEGDYENFSRGALRCYDTLWEPTKHLARIAEAVEEI